MPEIVERINALPPAVKIGVPIGVVGLLILRARAKSGSVTLSPQSGGLPSGGAGTSGGGITGPNGSSPTPTAGADNTGSLLQSLQSFFLALPNSPDSLSVTLPSGATIQESSGVPTFGGGQFSTTPLGAVLQGANGQYVANPYGIFGEFPIYDPATGVVIGYSFGTGNTYTGPGIWNTLHQTAPGSFHGTPPGPQTGPLPGVPIGRQPGAPIPGVTPNLLPTR